MSVFKINEKSHLEKNMFLMKVLIFNALKVTNTLHLKN
ncbi:UNVERIFIED_ORG: hypothetical protein [Escherichia phage CMSTMSU]